jgi:hypothetical protein
MTTKLLIEHLERDTELEVNFRLIKQKAKGKVVPVL